MKESIAREWVKRLRSGEIQQAKGILGTNDGARCCLGVLCDLAVRDGVIEKPREYNETTHLVYAKEAMVLPMKVRDWAGIKSGLNGTFQPGSDLESITLSHLNDSGYNFEHIADIIEKHYDKI
jgi:hypothetical protein